MIMLWRRSTAERAVSPGPGAGPPAAVAALFQMIVWVSASMIGMVPGRCGSSHPLASCRGLAGGEPDRGAQLRRPGCEQLRRLVHVPPGRRDADREPGRELGERLAFAQVGQDEQGLLPGVQLPPARPDRLSVAGGSASGGT